MAIGITTQGISFYVESPQELVCVPERQQVLNPFDFIGEQESLLRLPNENNAEYKQRIMDLEVHKGGPSYNGIVNNLSRSFGYPRLKCLTITLNTDTYGVYLAASPKVDVLANRIILYSDWRPTGTEVIDKEILFYSPDDDGFFIEDLVSEINSSTCFSATLENGIRPNLYSTNLIQQSSSVSINGDVIQNNKRTKLSADIIAKDSLVFEELDIFKTEVLTTPSSPGEYLVDYLNGTIESFSIPSGQQEVSYYYCNFPLVFDYSLVKVYTLQDENFLNELFNKETSVSGEEINTLLNTEGSEIFNQLYNEVPVFWGE